jgi:hypothetical protein
MGGSYRHIADTHVCTTSFRERPNQDAQVSGKDPEQTLEAQMLQDCLLEADFPWLDYVETILFQIFTARFRTV